MTLNLSGFESIPGSDGTRVSDPTVGFNGGPISSLVDKKIRCPREPITQNEFDKIVSRLRLCVDRNGTINSCESLHYIVRQLVTLDEMIDGNQLSPCIGRFGSATASQIQQTPDETAQEIANTANNNLTTDAEIDAVFNENGNAGLGTLLLPFLYIRWGETVLHNSFPSFLLDEPVPQVKDNVAAFEITIDTATGGGTSSGGSGSAGAGTSTCELTLNPHLVDAEGNDIVVNTDGAELTIIWGYPNSNQVRRHTFAQVGIKDKYFNEQSTQLSFRGLTWKLTRLSEQKRYPSSQNMTERVIEMSRAVCDGLGYGATEAECSINITPEGFFDDIAIGETVQTSDASTFLADVVERQAGCTLNIELDSNAFQDAPRGKQRISINCENSLNDEQSPDLRTNLVDRALWLGQGLAEVVTLSDVGDNASAHANTGGNCGSNALMNRTLRPKNVVLKSFSEGCDYRLLNPSQITNVAAGAQGEFLLRLEKDQSDEVPLLSPFKGEIIDVGPDPLCSNSEGADNTCFDPSLLTGSGNFVKIKADEPNNDDLNGIVWTFYHLANFNVSIGDTVVPGQVVATQGRSGSAELQVTGIRIERDGTKLPEDEVLPIVDDYIDTITFSCDDLNVSCITENFISSPNVNGIGGAPNHLHLGTKRGIQSVIQAFDAMASADTDTCYNLNSISNGTYNVGRRGETACWNPNWDASLKNEVASNCSKSHRHSVTPGRTKCDFYVFDKTQENIQNGGRFGASAARRPIANPYPGASFVYIDGGNQLQASQVFFDSDGTIPDNTLGFGNDAGFAQIFHGDRQYLIDNGEIFGQVKTGCGESGPSDFQQSPLTNDDEFSNVRVILEYMKRKGLLVRKPPASEPATSFATNIVGLRGINENLTQNNDEQDVFNDLIVVFGLNNANEVQVYSYSKGTTQPSQYYIDRAPNGAEVLSADESYRGLWREGSYLCEPNLQDGAGRCISPALIQARSINAIRNNAQIGITSGTNFIHSYGGPASSVNQNDGTGQVLVSRGSADPWISARNGWQNDYLYIKNAGNATFDYVLIDGNTFISTVGEDTDNEFLANIANAGINTVEEQVSQQCGPEGQYANMTQSYADELIAFCEANKCNAKDVAAFIMAESSWNINAQNGNNCFGIFQCCVGQAPEAAMKAELEAQGQFFFNDCRSLQNASLELQLKAWLAYKTASAGVSGGVPISGSTLCEHYTEIAVPALVPAVQRNPNANFLESCLGVGVDRSTCENIYRANQNSWFRGQSLENAQIKGICDYAKRSAVDDPRLGDGTCTFFTRQSNVPSSTETCSNSSSNRALNARNTGTLSTGGLRNLKFRQEIRLNTEFGICPRNVFLAPVDANGRPMYLLLANMDNSAGFADFKIRSVSLSWAGHFRWAVTAYRPADSVTFELPPTLAQPRSLNEWINYYWFFERSFFAEANQFAAPGRRSTVLQNGALDGDQDITGSSTLPQSVTDAIVGVFEEINKAYQQNDQSGEFTQEQSNQINALALQVRNLCSGSRQASCLSTVEGLEDSRSFSYLSNVLTTDSTDNSSRITLRSWIRRELKEPFGEPGDRADSAL